jgi:hypothetical protein
MASYNVSFGQNSKIVPALVLPAFIYLPLIFLSFEYLPDFNGWNPIITSILYLALTACTVLYLLKKINRRVTVSVEPSFIKVSFDSRNLFSRKDFNFSLQDIKNYWEQEDKGYAFLHLDIAGKPSSFFFGAQMDKETDYKNFIGLRNEIVTEIEAAVKTEGAVITSESMFEDWWAIILALIAAAVIVGFPILKLTGGYERGSWTQYFTVVCFGSLFISTVYYYNFIKNKK